MSGGCRVVQLVERAPRGDAGALFRRVDLDDGVQVLGEIDNDRDVAAFAGETRSTSAAQHGSSVLATHMQRCNDVVDRLGNDDADGNLPVVGGIGGVERPAPTIEAHFPLDRAREFGRQRAVVRFHPVLAVEARSRLS
jgi:hypothetical protein